MYKETLTIEKGVPVVTGRQRWPFDAMAPTDSFLALESDDAVRRFRMRRTVAAAARRYMQKHPDVKLLVSSDGHHVRCWRME